MSPNTLLCLGEFRSLAPSWASSSLQLNLRSAPVLFSSMASVWRFVLCPLVEVHTASTHPPPELREHRRARILKTLHQVKFISYFSSLCYGFSPEDVSRFFGNMLLCFFISLHSLCLFPCFRGNSLFSQTWGGLVQEMSGYHPAWPCPQASPPECLSSLLSSGQAL